MLKTFFIIILLLFSLYIYATVSASARAEINHNTVMIPKHIGDAIGSISDRFAQQDFSQNAN